MFESSGTSDGASPNIVRSNPTRPTTDVPMWACNLGRPALGKVALAESFQIASRSEFLVRELEPAS